MNRIFFGCSLIVVALLFELAAAPPLRAAHGVSIDGRLKYPAGFKQFEYTSEKAVKGGQLLLHDIGSYDKLNPFTLKGMAPAGLEELVFETLAVPALDEPFAEYGLIAKDIELAPDRLSVIFTIDEAARFADGTPVTPEDVKFSLDTLKSEAAHPFYQSYFQDIVRAEVLDKQRVRFQFAKTNRELHLVACQVPVLSRKFYKSHNFDSQEMTAPVGSGPYQVVEISPGKSITYQRNPEYWAKEHPVRRNMFNFDRITYKYYKDQVVAVEAFKAHEFDFMYVNIAKQWVRDLTGPKFDSKQIVKDALLHRNNAGMQGFVFNTRRPLFADRRVRQALSLAFDFEWANSKLFFDQYTRCASYFSNSDLAATGLPQGLELAYLTPHQDKLPAEVFSVAPTPFSTLPPTSLRENLLTAKKLLADAGWQVRDGQLVNKAGQSFTFEILLVSPSFERVMAGYAKNLEKLGIKASYRAIDPALYTDRLNRFDFDMVVNVFGQSQSPGNEQRDYWHSSVADREGSKNLIGVRDPVVDELVDKIIYAKTQEELVAACRALDRVLWYGHYVVPNWYVAKHRLAYWNVFARPATLPRYYSPQQALMTWWFQAR
ncbi:MAG: peptide ABC transporter substrate-binding protein [Deltaproteobacteria bacterium RIFOXYD12_FULL_57_12]|nr:MAG: peptide ABC transporter substrate-binding protein [Deltaproteobacteria bacterium RIFOXYD12_FULL_57_12]